MLWTRDDVDLPTDGSAVLVDDQVLSYTLTAEPGDRLHRRAGFVALDAATGEERWRFTVDALFVQLAVSPGQQAALLLVDDTLVRLDLRTGRRLDTTALPDARPDSDRWSMITRVETYSGPSSADAVLLTGDSLLLKRDGPGDAVPAVHQLDLADGSLELVDVAPSSDCEYQLPDELDFDSVASSDYYQLFRTIVRDGRGCGDPTVIRLRDGDRRVYTVPALPGETACVNGCELEGVVATQRDIAFQLPRYTDGAATEVVMLGSAGRLEERIPLADPSDRLEFALRSGDGTEFVLIEREGRIDAVDFFGDPISLPGALPVAFLPGQVAFEYGGHVIGFGDPAGGNGVVVVVDIEEGIERARSADLGCRPQRISVSGTRALVSCQPQPGQPELVMLG